jgi:glycosyltransferase involved in cell wall biosynthesis
MRILYDHQVTSLQDAGGGSRYHYELLRYLSAVPDVQTEIVLGMNGSVYPFAKLSSAKTRVMEFGAVFRPSAYRYAMNELLGNSIAVCRGRFDVYHPTHHRVMPIVRSRRIVATHYDCTNERFPEAFRYAKEVLRAKKSLFARADAIICISECTRKDLLEFYPDSAAKARVIYLGVSPLPRSPLQAEKLREQLRREYVLYVGQRAAYNLFSELLYAFREAGLHTAMDLVLFGGLPLTSPERELIRKLDLEDSVINVRSVPDEMLSEAYASAKLFVFPSLSEGFGFPPLEAMACGCPVLASYASSIPEVCKDAPMYFCPEEEGAFARALLKAINDEPARMRSIQRGKEVVQEYSWEKCGMETLSLYRECL